MPPPPRRRPLRVVADLREPHGERQPPEAEGRLPGAAAPPPPGEVRLEGRGGRGARRELDQGAAAEVPLPLLLRIVSLLLLSLQ